MLLESLGVAAYFLWSAFEQGEAAESRKKPSEPLVDWLEEGNQRARGTPESCLRQTGLKEGRWSEVKREATEMKRKQHVA